MIRIDSTGARGLGLGGIQRSQEEIKNHVAWRSEVTEISAETLLKGEPVFTYILRPGDREEIFFISFMHPDNTIHHQRFAIERNSQGWYFQNCVKNGCEENIEALIPMMMHCTRNMCIPFRE